MRNIYSMLKARPWTVLLPAGLVVHVAIAVFPLVAEIRLTSGELSLLRDKTNEERRKLVLGGKLDFVEDHQFIARCQRQIPADAEVLIVSNSMTNVFILNYYLYPRKTSTDAETLKKGHWTVHYFTPKDSGKKSVEGPVRRGSAN